MNLNKKNQLALQHLDDLFDSRLLFNFLRSSS